MAIAKSTAGFMPIFMQRAVELARNGLGFVEPNPLVGCVIVKDGNIIGKGFHRYFGGNHAEIEAINNAEQNGFSVAGADCYVTLEPCSHFGKTPPCAHKLAASGIKRVAAAMRDPNPAVNGRGFAILREAGIEVDEGILENEVRSLNAPYLTRLEKQRPWFIAKWAMTADGKIAAKTGESNWISCEESRRFVHRLRSRMDAILVGSGTVKRDNCRLTVRLTEEEQQDEILPKRTPLRIVLNSAADLPLDCCLVQTAKDIPVLIAVSENAPEDKIAALEKHRCRIFRTKQPDLSDLFRHLVKKGITNVLVEGGGKVFGTFFDLQIIDEVHIFTAPKIIGGETAISPLGGSGLGSMDYAAKIVLPQIQIAGEDIYLSGRLEY